MLLVLTALGPVRGMLQGWLLAGVGPRVRMGLQLEAGEAGEGHSNASDSCPGLPTRMGVALAGRPRSNGGLCHLPRGLGRVLTRASLHLGHPCLWS